MDDHDPPKADPRTSQRRDRRARFRLEDMLAECDLTQPRSQELIDWEQAPPVGRELS